MKIGEIPKLSIYIVFWIKPDKVETVNIYVPIGRALGLVLTLVGILSVILQIIKN